MKALKLLLIASMPAALVLAGCTQPENKPRRQHENPKIWMAQQTPEDQDVTEQEFYKFNLSKAYAAVADPKQDLTRAVLVPLSKFVLNAKFIEVPKYRSTRLSEMISIFNTAFYIEYKKTNRSSEFASIRTKYQQTVFAGCSFDLKTDCRNATLFSLDSRHTQNIALLASELDVQIDAKLAAVGGNEKACVRTKEHGCRDLVNERYRILTMALHGRSGYMDRTFAFAYMKYARLFAELVDYLKGPIPVELQTALRDSGITIGYLGEVHTKIFETIVTKFQLENAKSDEFMKFVKTFNPWVHSRKDAGLFQNSMRSLFRLAAECCFYSDAGKTKLDPQFATTILTLQNEKSDDLDVTDVLSPTLLDIVTQIEMGGTTDSKNRVINKMIKNLDLGGLTTAAKSKAPNEIRFIVDRLFRGHLNIAEVEMLLKNASPNRVKTELPRIVQMYVKLYLAYMVLETNRFMGKIYASDIGSDRIFEEALANSRQLTSNWLAVQGQIDLLDRLTNNYFNSLRLQNSDFRGISDCSKIEDRRKNADCKVWQDFSKTNAVLKSVNRNVHYISVFPNMMVMTYFLSSKKGTIIYNAWWGQVTIKADDILKNVFNGAQDDVWFPFGKDPESMDQVTLLIALEYLLSTDGLKDFADKSSTIQAGSPRSRFFDLIFNKYLGDVVDAQVAKLNTYRSGSADNHRMSSLIDICNYEMGISNKAPDVSHSLLDLGNYTYAGIGRTGINTVLIDQLTAVKPIATELLKTIEPTKTFVLTMMDVIKADLRRNGETIEGHPDLLRANEILEKLANLEVETAKLFVANHEYFLSCSVKLRDVERRRAFRLYEEEKIHLGQIFDRMKPLVNIADSAELEQQALALNTSYFRGKAENTNNSTEYTYEFDGVIGRNYQMSKYDLYMRMKKRIESDVFLSVTADEGRLFDAAETAAYIRPRRVKVSVPEAVKKDAMFTEGTSTSITIRGTTEADRNAFIREGMAQLNGLASAYIRWQDQMQKDTSLVDFNHSLGIFYVLQPIGKDREESAKLSVSAKQLTDAYLKVLSTVTLDTYDVEVATLFGATTRFEKKFYIDRWFEKDGFTRLPLFYPLTSEIINLADASMEKSGIYNKAFGISQKFNSLLSFVFPMSPAVEKAASDHFGAVVHHRMRKISELSRHLEGIDERAKHSEVKLRSELGFDVTRPFFMEGNQPVTWFRANSPNLLDRQRLQDQDFLRSNFINRTGNFFKTRTEVPAK